MYMYQVKGANPNGSPDWDNLPRTLSDESGMATDNSLRAKLREIMSDHTSPVFLEIAEALELDPEKYHVLESKFRGMNTEDACEAAQACMLLAQENPDAFLDKYWDVRLFGTTLLEKKLKGQKEGLRFKKTGCVTISSAFSVAPIDTIESTITKRFPFNEEHLKNENSDMAPQAKKLVKHGLYVGQIGVNPHRAHTTKATKKDIEVLKYIFKYAFSVTEAACRPAGSINFAHIWWADHTNALGSFNELEFFETLQPKRIGEYIPSKGLEDYNIPTPDFQFDVEDLA